MIEYFLWGSLLKLYDDLCSDNHIITNKVFNEVLKGLLFIITTYVFTRDFNIGITWYLLFVFHSITNKEMANKPFEKAGMILIPLILLIGFNTRTYLSIIDILFLFSSISFSTIEPVIFKEEYSLFKFISRCLNLIMSIVVICFSSQILQILHLSQYIAVSDYIIKTMYINLGYFSFSGLFQLYSLYIKQTPLESVEKSVVEAPVVEAPVVEAPMETPVETRPETPKEVEKEIKEEDALRV